MSEQTTQPQEPEISEEEARAHLAEVESKIEKASAKARAMFTQNIKLADERIEFAEKQLAETSELRAKIAEHEDAAGAAPHLQNMDLLNRVYGSIKTMMSIEKSANEANLAILDIQEIPEETPTFHIPANNPRYLEARSMVDYHMGYFMWLSNLEGIDVVMRTSLEQAAVTPQNEEEAAWRQNNVAELKAAMAANRELAQAVGQWGTELQESQALLEWAAGSLGTVIKLAPDAKKSYLEDPDWAKLNAKVLFLGELTDKAQAFPELAKHFPVPEAAPLPYEQFIWTEEAPGTGRLSGTGRLAGQGGQTGRLQGQTGRLPQGGGAGQTGRLPR